MSIQAEANYARLLEEKKVSHELVEHPQFYRSFVKKFDEMSVDGKYTLNVHISGDRLTLVRYSDYPNATNGYYDGYKDVTGTTFSLEHQWDKTYFRVERDCSSVYTIPKKGDALTNSSEVEIYEDNALLGRSYFADLAGNNVGGHITPALGFRKPHLTAGFILQGMIPQEISHLVAGDYVCNVAGRVNYEQGLVQKASVSRTNGKYKGGFSVAAVNLENTMTIDNAADIVIYDKDMNMIRFNTYFASPQEAKEASQLRYEEAIGKKKAV